MEEAIKDIYGTSFGTAHETYEEAVNIDSSIRLQDVSDYVNKGYVAQVKSKPEAYNSAVSPDVKFEYEADNMDMESQDANLNARYGLVAIENFTKIPEVAPIKNRTPEAMIDGLKKIFISMGNQSSYIHMNLLSEYLKSSCSYS